MQLAENAGCKKSPSAHRTMSSQLRHASTIGKKLVKQQYLLQTSSQYGELRNFGLPAAEMGPVVWGHPS